MQNIEKQRRCVCRENCGTIRIVLFVLLVFLGASSSIANANRRHTHNNKASHLLESQRTTVYLKKTSTTSPVGIPAGRNPTTAKRSRQVPVAFVSRFDRYGTRLNNMGTRRGVELQEQWTHASIATRAQLVDKSYWSSYNNMQEHHLPKDEDEDDDDEDDSRSEFALARYGSPLERARFHQSEHAFCKSRAEQEELHELDECVTCKVGCLLRAQPYHTEEGVVV